MTLDNTTPFLSAALSYGANDVDATLTRSGTSFASVAATPNQQQVAQALDTLDSSNSLYNIVARQASASDAEAAFRRLTGELHADIKGAVMEDDERAFRLIDGRLREREPRTGGGAWAEEYGEWNDRSGDGTNTQAFANAEHGVMFGIDGMMEDAPGWRLGTAFGFGQSNYRLTADPGNSAKGGADHYRLAAYAERRWGGLSLYASGDYAYHRIDTDRFVSFDGYQGYQRAAYHAETLGGFAGMAYGLAVVPKVRVEPFANLTYGYTLMSNFGETGANGLHAGEDTAVQGATMLGARVWQRIDFTPSPAPDAAYASLALRAGWRHRIGVAAPEGVYTFTGSAPFTTTGARDARDALALAFGVDVHMTRALSLNLAYDASLASAASSNAVHGTLIWRW